MAAVKRTYALPAEMVERFEQVVAPGKRSAVLTEALSAWLEERKRAELRQEIAEGCCEMWDIYLEAEREFNPLEEEIVHRYGEGD
ncbi:MAG: hypothetical protein HYX78_00820 [Armatimonadetes bacterium]|nr:hypothetical protein [Armatimonadota bacterium]